MVFILMLLEFFNLGFKSICYGHSVEETSEVSSLLSCNLCRWRKFRGGAISKGPVTQRSIHGYERKYGDGGVGGNLPDSFAALDDEKVIDEKTSS